MTEYASRQYDHRPTDRPLGRDIRLLGWQLRRLVQRHGGEDLWASVHRLRDLAEARREGDLAAEDKMAGLIAGCSHGALEEMTRVVGLFFDLANMTEDRHRVRVLRRRQRLGLGTETVAEAACAMREAGLGDAAIRARLAGLRIEPVLTAHPTEAKRRSVRRAMRRLRRDLALLDQPDLTRAHRRRRLARMRRDMASLWYTDPVSPRKPEVMEELRRALFAARTMWRVVPRVMADVRDAFPDQPEVLAPPAHILAFGNWVGGDRDGNPYVTTRVTRDVFRTLRRTAVRLHRRECQRVRSRLTVSDARGGRPYRLIKRIHDARQRWPRLGRKLDRLHPDEWFVQWLTIIQTRLSHSQTLPGEAAHAMAYARGQELMADVELMADALQEIDHDELLSGALLRWRDRLACFGLHLLRLDVRVNSRSVAEAVGELMRQAGIHHDYAGLEKPARLPVLRSAYDALTTCEFGPADLSETCADLMKLFRMLQRLAAAGYREAIGPVIVSMTHDATDILAVRWLAHAAARSSSAPPEPLSYAPLFETIPDLEIADRVLDELLADAGYRGELGRVGDTQMCMIGYSDSAKDGGYLSACWSLYGAQRRLAQRARDHDVELTLFHGRGGAIGRGGGPAARAIRSLPPESVDGRLRLTEQGEVIAERYDDPAIAVRHLEQLVWSTLTLGAQEHAGSGAEDLGLAAKMAGSSYAAYRRLIDHPSFAGYLRECTALPLIETLRIGSRPSRRTASASFDDLRAIPYTFAWNQVRMPINAFYGLGDAFARLSQNEQQCLARRYSAWPWLQAVVDNAELALARCDPAIARRYATLPGASDAAIAVWEELFREFALAREAVLLIKGQTQLLGHVDWLRRAMRVRTPYLDILNLIQLELLSRQKRPGEHTADPGLEHTLRRTVQAIASGLRNTG